MKQFILVYLLLQFSVGVFGQAIDNFTVTVENTEIGDVIIIEKYTGNEENVVIPEYINGYLVTKIRMWSFSGTIKTITIPASIKKIGIDFSGRDVSPFHAFMGCNEIESFYVAEGNNYFCSVDGILFSKDETILYRYPRSRSGAYLVPEGVEIIYDWAFAQCVNLSSVIFPISLQQIGYEAFRSCLNLSTILFESLKRNDGTYLSYENLNIKIDLGAFNGGNSLSENIRSNLLKRFGPIIYENER